MSDSIVLRLARLEDESFLLAMLFHAAHAGDDPDARPEHLLAEPALARYVAGFGRCRDDLGIIAEDGGAPVGAAWLRLLAGDNRGYGWFDDHTPELAIAVMPAAIQRGLGTRMLHALLEQAAARFPAVSLSVRKDNPARRLYERTGFAPVREVTNRVGGISEIMVKRFDAG